MNLLNSYLLLPHRTGKPQKIQFSDILYLEGIINYTLIHLQDGKVKLSPRTLLFHINNSLDESFIRIHRTYCVNKQFIQDYDYKLNPKYLLLKGGVSLKVSRRKNKVLNKLRVQEIVCPSADPQQNSIQSDEEI